MCACNVYLCPSPPPHTLAARLFFFSWIQNIDLALGGVRQAGKRPIHGMKKNRRWQQLRMLLREFLRTGSWGRPLGGMLGRLQENKAIRDNILQAIPFWIASFIVGLVAVMYAQLFSWAERLSEVIHEVADWSIFIMMPLCVVLAWWLVRRFAPGSRGSGIPQVIAALEIATAHPKAPINRLLSLRIVVIKVASSMLMVLGGAAIGREGPTIQISAAIFKRVNDILPHWWPKVANKNMILTGAAAGLAAAFNTPLGGIVFAVEELSKTHFARFRTAIFTAVIIAGLTAQGIAGPYLYLGYPKIDNYSLSIFWGILLVALISGFLGAGTSKAIVKIFAWKDKFKKVNHHLGYLLLCSLALSSMIYFGSHLAMGSGKEVMEQTLFEENKRIEWHLPLMRMAAPIISFSTGGSGGIFAPSLSTGATVGASVAGWFDLNSPNTNLLILTGMVAFLTGITRSPFTSAILVLEMTDRHSLIFHLMAAGLIANLCAYFVDRRSLYEHLKERFLREYAAAPPVEVKEDEFPDPEYPASAPAEADEDAPADPKKGQDPLD